MNKPNASLADRWTRAGEHKIYARVSRGQTTAPPVILVHGFVISSVYMRPVAERLAPFFTVLAPDLPGFGNSSKPARTLDIPELADALIAWMDALEIEKAAFLGNSMGCQVIVDLAVRHPERVDRVVLVGPSLDPAGRTCLEQMTRLLLDVPRERLSLLLLNFLDYFKAGIPRAWRTFRHALRDPIEEKLPSVQAPALVICGSRDPIAPPSWSGQVARLLPHGRFEVIPGGSHAVHYGKPREVARLVREFLEKGRAAHRAA